MTLERDIDKRTTEFLNLYQDLNGPLPGETLRVIGRMREYLKGTISDSGYVLLRNGRVADQSDNVEVINMDRISEIDEQDVVEYSIMLDDFGLYDEAFEVLEEHGMAVLERED